MELKVILDFACCECAHNIGVTLQCMGSALAFRGGAVAAVNIPCPTCGNVNRLEFDPAGIVHAVKPCPPRPAWIEPSVN